MIDKQFVAAEARAGGYKHANESWSLKWTLPNENNRKTLVNVAVAKLMSAYDAGQPTNRGLSSKELSKLKAVVSKDPQIVGFIGILGIILGAILSFAIGKLLDWIWDNYFVQP